MVHMAMFLLGQGPPQPCNGFNGVMFRGRRVRLIVDLRGHNMDVEIMLNTKYKHANVENGEFKQLSKNNLDRLYQISVHGQYEGRYTINGKDLDYE